MFLTAFRADLLPASSRQVRSVSFDEVAIGRILPACSRERIFVVGRRKGRFNEENLHNHG